MFANQTITIQFYYTQCTITTFMVTGNNVFYYEAWYEDSLNIMVGHRILYFTEKGQRRRFQYYHGQLGYSYVI